MKFADDQVGGGTAVRRWGGQSKNILILKGASVKEQSCGKKVSNCQQRKSFVRSTHYYLFITISVPALH